jgi:hypothetical protein
MPDRKLQYWYDWEIYGPDGSLIIQIGRPPAIVERERLRDIEYLCEIIETNPERALMDRYVWYQIVMLRQMASKNQDNARRYDRVCKAICGDRRKRKKQSALEELRIMIGYDIDFFRTIRRRIEDEDVSVRNAIYHYLTEDVPETATPDAADRRDREMSNYYQTYLAYKRIYDELISAELPDEAIFRFFETAGEYIEATNATIGIHSNENLITFVKKKTWYVEGTDMVINEE